MAKNSQNPTFSHAIPKFYLGKIGEKSEFCATFVRGKLANFNKNRTKIGQNRLIYYSTIYVLSMFLYRK
nr:MAG TPA: hypothetical protein [Caudoviricetes sp.]